MKNVLVLIVMFVFISGAAAEEKEVHIACAPWQPYWGEELPNNGILGEIVNAAYARKGYKTHNYVIPWARVLREVETGRLDATVCAYYTDERAKKYLFSEPVMITGRLAFYKRKGETVIWKFLEDLKPYRIGILRDSAYSEEFDKANFLNKEPVSNEVQNLKKLLAKRIDLTPMDPAVANYLIDRHLPEQKNKFESLLPLLREGQKVFLMFSREIPDVRKKIQMINEGLSEIRQDGTYRKILSKYGIKEQSE